MVNLDKNPSEAEKTCGIVMPISAIDGCSESHWSELLSVFSEAIVSAEFKPQLVSYADEINVIQKTIVQNLYDNPIVVCDVSAKNPNVMFELGLRLAFDKPTVIVKDDRTSFTFDTSLIEHIEYPRDLRYSQIVEFKIRLADKIKSTYKASNDPKYSTFLKHFGEFKVAKIVKTEVPGVELILDELKSMRSVISEVQKRSIVGSNERNPQDSLYHNTLGKLVPNLRVRRFDFPSMEDKKSKRVISNIRNIIGVLGVDIIRVRQGLMTIEVLSQTEDVENQVKEYLSNEIANV